MRTKTGRAGAEKRWDWPKIWVWADRAEVTLGCRSTVLSGKVGRTSPDAGPKPEVTRLEHQRKISKTRINFPGEARG